MITHKTGDIFNSECQALVNPVNCVGVMGKGLALQFKIKMPAYYFLEYKKECHGGLYLPGVPRYVEVKSRFCEAVVNFPTKEHWRHPSRIEWIKIGAGHLRDLIRQHQIKSIAVPPLGAGLGGLNSKDVLEVLTEKLADLNCKVDFYNFQDSPA